MLPTTVVITENVSDMCQQTTPIWKDESAKEIIIHPYLNVNIKCMHFEKDIIEIVLYPFTYFID